MHLPVDRATKTKDHRAAVAARHEGRDRGYAQGPIDAGWLRSLALDCGADDVGFASLDAPALEEERPYASEAMPGLRSFVSFCVRLNRDNIRSPARSLTNNEWHAAGDRVDEVGRAISMALQDAGYRAANPSMAFPQEMQRYPNRIWVVAHKKVAVAAGLGHMGINRNVLHPRFGSFMLLGTILLAAEIDEYAQPLEWNPCLGCNLCVAACPVGAIKKDGEDFDFLSCYTHNYREFMGGFTDWVEQIADSEDAKDYEERVSDQETASMWQSLSYKPGYKAAYCVSVCPAGDDVIGPFLHDRKAHMRDVVKPLQEKREAVYVQPHSPAHEHVRKRFPHKTPRLVSTRLRPPKELIDPGPAAPEEEADGGAVE